MSQAAQAKNLHEDGVQRFEEARRNLADAIGRTSLASTELAKGNLTPEASAVWREKFDTAYDESDRLMKLASLLEKDLKLGQPKAKKPPVYRRQMEAGAADPDELSADGEGDEELGEATTFEEAEARVLSRRSVMQQGDVRLGRLFTLRERSQLNKVFRGRNGFQALSAKQLEHLSRDRSEQLMSPYIDRDGGTITGEEIRNEVLTHVRDQTHIRSRAFVISTTSASVAFPSLRIPNVQLKPTRAGEGNGEGHGITLRDIFGKLRFVPSGSSRIVRMPEELLDDATFDIVGFIAREIGLNDLEGEEAKFLTGSGSSEPLGILTALAKLKAAGYPELSFPHTGSGAANFTPEDIRVFRYYLKSKYRGGGTNAGPVWMGPRAFIRAVTVMRTNEGGAGTGTFLFQNALSAGDPATLAGDVFLESEFFPDKVTSGTAGDPMVLYGNLSYYWIVDRSSLELKVLPELYAETDEVGYKFSKRFDAAPVRPDPFVMMERK
jgi:HK97 family phage major capsid protein